MNPESGSIAVLLLGVLLLFEQRKMHVQRHEHGIVWLCSRPTAEYASRETSAEAEPLLNIPPLKAGMSPVDCLTIAVSVNLLISCFQLA